MNDHLLLERARALGASDLSIDEVSLLVQRAMESEEFRDALGDIPGVPERLADWQQKEQRREQDEKIRDFPVQALAAAGTVFVMVVFGMTWLLVARPWERQPVFYCGAIKKRHEIASTLAIVAK